MAIIEFTQLSAFVKLTSETRVFKKDIEYFIGEFIEDCDLFVLLNPQQDSAEIDAIIEESVDL